MNRQQIRFKPEQLDDVKTFMRELWAEDIPESHFGFEKVREYGHETEPVPAMSLDMFLASMSKQYDGVLQFGDPFEELIRFGVRNVYLPDDALIEYFAIHHSPFNEETYWIVKSLYESTICQLAAQGE